MQILLCQLFENNSPCRLQHNLGCRANVNNQLGFCFVLFLAYYSVQGQTKSLSNPCVRFIMFSIFLAIKIDKRVFEKCTSQNSIKLMPKPPAMRYSRTKRATAPRSLSHYFNSNNLLQLLKYNIKETNLVSVEIDRQNS